MKVDINRYIVNKEFTTKWYDKNGGDPRLAVSMVAVSTMCPCIVIAFYLGEHLGWPKEILDAIDDFVKFYGYTDILGIPDSYPNKNKS